MRGGGRPQAACHVAQGLAQGKTSRHVAQGLAQGKTSRHVAQGLAQGKTSRHVAQGLAQGKTSRHVALLLPQALLEFANLLLINILLECNKVCVTCIARHLQCYLQHIHLCNLNITTILHCFITLNLYFLVILFLFEIFLQTFDHGYATYI